MRKSFLCFILVFVKGSLPNKGKSKKVYSNICKMKESLRSYIQIFKSKHPIWRWGKTQSRTGEAVWSFDEKNYKINTI